MPVQVMVSGVGRSGTTALYGVLQKLFSSSGIDVRNAYEPYLWRTEAFEHLAVEEERFGNAFATTAALSVEGMYVHAKTPLFTERSPAVHAKFIDGLFPPERGTLTKIIRGCGRLKTFLHARPQLKILHIVRNPLDVVNSVTGMFSFFGDEFHPSDKPRFAAEVEKRFGVRVRVAETVPQDLSEVAWSALWWRHMNEAALQTAEEFPDRCLLLSQEALASVRDATVRKVADFCGIHPQESLWDQVAETAWSSGADVRLTKDALSILRPLADHYWTTIAPRLDVGIEIDRAEIQRTIELKYETAADVPPVLYLVSRDLGPVTLRVKHRLDSAQLQRQLDEASARLQEKQLQLDEAAGQIQEQQLQLDEAAARLQEQQVQLDEAAGRIQEQQLQLDEAAARLQEQQVQLDEAAGRIQEQQVQLEEAAGRLQEQARQLREAAGRFQEQERRIESLAAQVETLRQDYDRIRNSRSWRYTRPLRGLADLVVGLNGGRQ